MSSAPPFDPSLLVQLPATDTNLDLSALNAHIATELAAGLSDAAGIREKYGITTAQWDKLKKSPAFRHMLAEAVKQLGGDMNASARIRMKADIILEDALPAYDAMIHDTKAPAQARIDAGKLIAAINGRTGKQGDGTPGSAGGGGGFILNINLGDRAEKLVIDGKSIPRVSDDE